MSRHLCLVFIATAFLASGQQVNQNPSRIFGHRSTTIVSTAPNLVEGKELSGPSAVAVDITASNPILYVADTGNNRVLAWRNASAFTKGAPADAVIGQRDLFTTNRQGPGTGLSTGFNAPNGLAVDRQGNLYIADAGNSRILRFRRPLDQPADARFPDMVIGQANFNGNAPNPTGVTASSLALRSGTNISRTGMAFDQQGNLWVSDTYNHRVLKYTPAALAGGNQPAAEVVLGQPSFTSAQLASNRSPLNAQALTFPTGLNFDTAGRLYICDSAARVVVFAPNPTTFAAAVRVMGVQVAQQNQTLPPVTEVTLGLVRNNRIESPQDVFFIGNVPFVVDTPTNRIVRYSPFESWLPISTQFSPSGLQFIGQRDALSFNPNGGLFEPNEANFSSPVAAAVTPTDVFIADQNNNRVLAFPLNGSTITAANRLYGQSEYYQSAINYVEGKELFLWAGWSSPGQWSDGAGVAIDSRSNPPRLYVADTYNHRILGFRDARAIRPGDRADIVIGQRNMLRAMVNDPTDRADQITATGLFLPSGIAVDAFGNLYVADSGNGRVLRFARPFDQGDRQQLPDLVLGQNGPVSKVTDASPRTMSRPYGLAFSTDGSLFVSDMAHNRVLFFRKPQGGDFSTGQAAEKVLGQPDFASTTGGTTVNRFNVPHSLAVDSSDRLYVCDTVNGRIQIFDSIQNLPPDPSPVLSLSGVGNPHGIAMNPTSGDFWVTNTTGSRLRHYPPFERIVFNPQPDNDVPLISGNAPLALAMDSFNNLVVAESINRISFYFSSLRLLNGGNYGNRFAPGLLTLVRPGEGTNFGDQSVSFESLPDPIPTVLGDMSVLVNGIPSPVQSVNAGEIKFYIPLSAPQSGEAEVSVLRQSTGQVIGTTTIQMSSVAPAFFTDSGDGRGQIRATNLEDGVPNSPVNPASIGSEVALFGTGIGLTANAIADGFPNSDPAPSSAAIRVLIQNQNLPEENVTFSGLAPGLVGVWQLTIRIPDFVRPGPSVPVAATVNSIPTGLATQNTIAVKPAPVQDPEPQQ